VGILYGLNDTEVDNISPEVLKSRLQDALQTIISSLAQRSPTVFLLEDLHWADPSFVALLRRCLSDIRIPAIVLCVYRPPFSLFTSHPSPEVAEIYQEIVLQDLSLSETQDMLESLLNSDAVPYGLKRVVQEKSEGNPFYLEELINSLIDSKTLIPDNGGWKLATSFHDLDISSTISGIISSRLDRLKKEAKRIIQEASVIGRTFLYEILRRITELREDIERSVRGLEQIDLIRTKSFVPDLEYIFKHALTQEVVYNGLLKKERQTIHERIGFVVEELFKDRLPEFYETLAFHFKKGRSIQKAVYYLSMSGEKSLKKSALDEAHKHFQDAYDILIEKSGKTKDEANLLIDLLVQWTFVFTYGANYRGLANLLGGHIHIAESLEDKERLGRFYACLGYALTNIGKPKDAHQYLLKALRFCEEAKNQRFTGFSCAWLSETCAELGLLDDAISFGKRGQDICAELEWDPLLFVESFGHGAHGHANRGEIKELEEIGNAFLDMGRRYSDYRHTSFGNFYLAWARLNAGDFPSAAELSLRAMELTKDPVVSYGSRMIIGGSYLATEKVQEAESTLEDLLRLDESLGGWEINKTAIAVPLALILFSKGHLTKGMRIVNDVQKYHLENGFRCRYAVAEYMLGRVYLRVVQKVDPINLLHMARNVVFLVKNVPFAAKKSEIHFRNAIETSKEIGAKGILGQSYLYLGILHKEKKRASPARESISEAIQLFKECRADMYLKQAEEVMASLE
jgi:tetratricopeptide (TPR) repeat protein